MKCKTRHVAFALALTLAGCVSHVQRTGQYSVEPPSIPPPSFRTISLDNSNYSEEEYGPFETWLCSDYISGRRVIVEVGRFEPPNFSEKGFILYDNTSSGELTSYQRRGVNRRWDWGPNAEYTFILKPDGTGLFYDFTNQSTNESIRASNVFKCSPVKSRTLR